jgi:serine/threonine-protein kinase
MLRALSAAHERTDAKGEPAPVIHRDVTPANVLIGINGSVKLADFGLSRAANRPRTTDPGTVKGKVAYMAPELLDNQKPDARSDIYSVGVTLWEAITAQRLYGGQMSDVEVAMRVLEGEPSTLTEAAPHAPAELADVVHRALAHAPDDRFQSATEMIVALSKLLRGAEIPTDGPALARSVRVARKLLAASG